MKPATKIRMLRAALRDTIRSLEFWSDCKATILPKSKKVLEQTKTT